MSLATPVPVLEPFAAGLAFPEGPRWHDGALWCSDIAAGQVLRFDDQGRATTVAEGIPAVSGLGWLPDGQLLAVAGQQRALLRHDGSRWHVHADLAPFVPATCNDMVVDAHGRAWVGNWGFDFLGGARPAATVVLRADPDGRVTVAADELWFPNGSVVTPDGRTLIVAETYGGRLTAFTIGDDGRLLNRRVWASFDAARPDGICLDAEGAIWLASPMTGEVLRVREGGGILARIRAPNDVVACMLGGADRRTLYVLSCPLRAPDDDVLRFHTPAEMCARRAGRIDQARVAVPGAGWP